MQFCLVEPEEILVAMTFDVEFACFVPFSNETSLFHKKSQSH